MKKNKRVHPGEITPEFLMGYALAEGLEHTDLSRSMGFHPSAMYNWVEARNGISEKSKLTIANYINKRNGYEEAPDHVWESTPLFSGEAPSISRVVSEPKQEPAKGDKAVAHAQITFTYKGEEINAIPGDIRTVNEVVYLVVFCMSRRSWVSVPLQDILVREVNESPDILPSEMPSVIGLEKRRLNPMKPPQKLSHDDVKRATRRKLVAAVESLCTITKKGLNPLEPKGVWASLHSHFCLNAVEEYNIVQLMSACEMIEQRIKTEIYSGAKI